MMLQEILARRDLTDPDQGPHAVQELAETTQAALADHWGCPRQVHRGTPIVGASDHYQRLGYAPEPAAPGSRGARLLTKRLLLRIRTAAAVPPVLRALSTNPPNDLLLVCPGITHRQDSESALHSSSPHLLDLWRLTSARLSPADLGEMVQTAVRAALPGAAYRLIPGNTPYMTHCMRIDAWHGEKWIEIGKCGGVARPILELNGMDPDRTSGLAMVFGLDRLMMVRKGIPDIRLLRAEQPCIARQMLDLKPFVAEAGAGATDCPMASEHTGGKRATWDAGAC